MHKKSKVILIISFISLIILASSFTHAGIFDIFKKEPSLGPVNVNVNLANSPPTIVKFFTIPSTPPFTQPYNLVAGSTSTAYFAFIAEDLDGANDLPTLSASGAGTSVVGGIGAPPSSVNPLIVHGITACTSFDCTTGAPGPPGQFFACDPSKLSIQKAYICDVSMTYSDPPSTSTTDANDLWGIGVGIIDNGGLQSTTIFSGTPGFDNVPNDYIQINPLSAYNIQVGSTISWSSLSLTSTNQPAAAPITVENYGNTPFTNTEITGSNLIGATNPSASIGIDAFSASGNTGGSPSSECNVPTSATQLQNSIPIQIQNGGLPYSASGATTDKKNIYACAYQSPSTYLTGVDSSFTGVWQVTLS